jgi:hypothetical protein
MHGFGYAAALALALVFFVAAAGKLRSRSATTLTFRSLGLPAPLATAVPAIELALAAGLALEPGWSAAVALGVLAAFSTFLTRALRRGVVVPCNCFGSASDAPLSSVDLLRNVVLAAAAIAALTASTPTMPSAAAVITVAALALAARLGLTTVRGREERQGTVEPGTNGSRKDGRHP